MTIADAAPLIVGLIGFVALWVLICAVGLSLCRAAALGDEQYAEARQERAARAALHPEHGRTVTALPAARPLDDKRGRRPRQEPGRMTHRRHR